MLGWYPGHMHKARRQITEALPEIDVVLEVLDARLPYSSANPMLAELTEHKPVLKVLSRADLADPEQTERWVQHFNAQHDIRALAVTTTQSRELKRIPALCHELAGHVRADRDVRVMVMGIPNVGKSTLINGLAGKKLAKTGNEPAVTKRQQKIRLDGRVALIDTPGVLWPKIEDQASAYRLAASGAIRDTAMDYSDVAIVAAAELAKRYPDALKARYKLKTLPAYTPNPDADSVEADGPPHRDLLALAGFDGQAIVEAIASKRGGLRAGGIVDMHRGAEVLLHELRDGKLGRLTLETPDDIPSPEDDDSDTPSSAT
ncbi:Ras superfamily GTP-binding protein YlqF [Chromohalobacter marismortui]|uniref:Ribosome biogenesis GTPase A n=1 Tax=Chromohalobacter marismortui TaxID=42055 RepID=A0A4R7NUP0_9GAMM|nr:MULTISPECIES: ribosome biogenesis GTPase YlqF [Chromohalobacter]MCI0510569.1 ribosome biogenesis GTPase YlqF [Chromohalobacter sp.]MCI0594078.1 ribosome biogenesis GTPase YlqF [Chromohalobacter sp.]TDU24854.1 Ras superfamily GTP-binding protein YlqF [Chromohalobacter marismortui]